MTTHTAGALFRQGDLDGAIDAAGDAVRREPADFNARLLLAELLLFAGDFERADAILDAASAIDPDAALVVAEFRQLLRAACARRELGTAGRVPEFIGAPTTAQTLALNALVSLRAGDQAAASSAAEAAEAARPRAAGVGNGAAFDDFRDADDLCAGSFEVLTTTGKYFWIPTERVLSAEFHPPRRPRDLFWRRCTMSVREGPDGEVYLPALYDEWPRQGSDRLASHMRLGRGTEWSETMPVRGIGQRVFLAGEEGVPVTALERLEFA